MLALRIRSEISGTSLHTRVRIQTESVVGVLKR